VVVLLSDLALVDNMHKVKGEFLSDDKNWLKTFTMIEDGIKKMMVIIKTPLFLKI
jgi:hypothetical protein